MNKQFDAFLNDSEKAKSRILSALNELPLSRMKIKIQMDILGFPVEDDPLLERLADLCHEQWAGWMRYLFEFGTKNEDGSFTMDADKVQRWTRQMNTPYDELSEQIKENDRIEAKKFLEVINETQCG